MKFQITILSFLLCVVLCKNSDAQWIQVSSGMGNKWINSLAFSGNYIFAGTASFHGVYISTNNGTNWPQTSLNSVDVISLAVNRNNIFVVAGSNGLFISINNGTN